MQILFITTKCPLPMNDGHSIRTFNLLQQVAKFHTIHLLSFVKFPEEYNYIRKLKQICKSVNLFDLPENNSRIYLFKSLLSSITSQKPFVATKYNKKSMRNGIKKIISTKKIDLVHLDMLPLGCYLNEFKNYKTLLNAHNVESFLLKRRTENDNHVLSKFYFTSQQRKLACFEKSICKRVDHIIACSQQDHDIFKNHFTHDTPITIVPNGVDIEFFSPQRQFKPKNNDIVFVGGLNWYPNIDGLRWFDKEVLPHMLKQKPDLHLHIIGHAPKGLQWRHHGNITCHGFVDDTRPFISKASVFIVPLRIGGGTRLKILNAMAMGKAVLSTPIGAEGLRAQDGIHVMMANDAISFARALISLINDREKRDLLGGRAREFIHDIYQWRHIANILLESYNSATSRG